MPPGHRRRRLLTLLGVSLLALFVVMEVLLFDSYRETAHTTRDFQQTTDTTTAIATVQREVHILRFEVHRTASRPSGGSSGWAGAALQRGLLERQLEVVRESGREPVRRPLDAIAETLARFDRAFREAKRDRAMPDRARLMRPLDQLDLQAKHLFDEEEHALYGALGQALNERAEGQRMIIALSVLALLLGVLLSAAIWRAVRRDFKRAYAALAAEAKEREMLQDQLVHQATHDALTGLGNRVQFKAELEAAPEGIISETAAILYIDLDGFKEINDTLGHDAGDELLVEVADRITQSVRPGDTLARLGGDEFAVLLGRVSGVDNALEVAERLRLMLSKPQLVRETTVAINACIGVALWDKVAGSEDEHVANADMAMYAAKRAGKGAVRLYEPAMAADAAKRVEIATAVRLNGTDLLPEAA